MAPLNATSAPTSAPTQNALQEFKTKFLSLNNLNTKETMDYFTQYRKEVNARIGELNQEERAILKDIVTLKYNDITTGTNTAAEKYLSTKQSEEVATASVPVWGKKANALNSIPDEDLTPAQPAPAVASAERTGPVEVVLPPATPTPTPAPQVAPAVQQVEGKTKGTAVVTPKTAEETAKRVEEIKKEYAEIDKEQGIAEETPKQTASKPAKTKTATATKTKQTENAPKLDDTATENKNPTEHPQTKTERNGDPIEARISPQEISRNGTKFTITRRINVPVNNQAYTNNEVSFAIEGENLTEILMLEKQLIQHELLTSLEVNQYLAGEKKIKDPMLTNVQTVTSTQVAIDPAEFEKTKAKNARFKNFLLELYAENEVAVVNKDESMSSLNQYIKERFSKFIDENPL